LFATFDEIGGLRPRAPVKIAGVRVGEVSAIVLDSDYRAKTSLDLEGSLELPSDTSASILTLGVLGDQYIALEPGGEEILLRPGDEIAFTQSAIILERLIGKLVQNIGGS
ncbi:MAG: outer membrane lipid asymmetry maintenance protein MlaD, partial [Myxococcales bacterium]|nr:outer membrane lipid asymmetry maintenance protein MlaD [Myxococcales bacterium]